MNQLKSAVHFIETQQDEDAKALLRHALKLATVDLRHPDPDGFDLLHYLKLILLMYTKRQPLLAALQGEGAKADWWGGA